MITASIVTYHNNKEDLNKVISSFFNYTNKSKLLIIDNSSDNSIKKLCKDSRIKYFYNNKNLGFGKAHNIGIEEAIKLNSKYHIILNPDIYFNVGVLEKLEAFMNKNEDVGFVLPKVMYPNNEIQYLTKLLPSPLELFVRRFIKNNKIKNKIDMRYELRFADFNRQIEAPYLSGCFMFCRTEILKKVNGFDDRFFMYMEDVDLSRRINQLSRTIYNPEVIIYHKFDKGSHKSSKLLYYHIISTFKYFNKWGWFFDKERKKINDKCITSILK